MLRTVVRDGQYIDSPLLREWVATRRRHAQDPISNECELAIVSLIADGPDNYAIAERMSISFHVVKFHIGKLLKRTGESNRAGLVRFAKERFIID